MKTLRLGKHASKTPTIRRFGCVLLLAVMGWSMTTVVASAQTPALEAQPNWLSMRLDDELVSSLFALAQQAFGAELLERLRDRHRVNASSEEGPSDGIQGPSPEEWALLDYYRKEAGYFEINAHLRGAQGSNYPKGALHAAAQLVASALNKLPTERRVVDEVVYRGTHLTGEFIEQHFKVGAIRREAGFTSCCLSRHVATIYARGAERVGKKQVLFCITSYSGRRLSEGIAGEVLFLPDTRFQVRGRSTDEWGRVVIEMSEVTD